jgi:hypothetical protein
MRPVVRGEWPKDADKKDIVYTEYKHARGELIRRLGEACSYCEMHLDSSLAVEHIQPKQPPGCLAPIAARELAWDNMLLACTNCNSTKGNTDVNLGDYIWPDRDNTFLALVYKEGGIVDVAPGPDKDRALRIVELVGLNVVPTKAVQAKEASDRRWNNRREAWDIAAKSRARLAVLNQPEMREQIVDGISGYWSVWMTVFKDDPDMLSRIINKISGTDVKCFDQNNRYVPIARV